MGLGNTGVTLSLRAHSKSSMRVLVSGGKFQQRFPVIVRIIRNPRLTGQTGQAGQHCKLTAQRRTQKRFYQAACQAACLDPCLYRRHSTGVQYDYLHDPNRIINTGLPFESQARLPKRDPRLTWHLQSYSHHQQILY